MSDNSTDFDVWFDGRVAQRVNTSPSSDGRWWNNTKRWEMRKKVFGYEGTFKTKVDIIYQRDAFKNLGQCAKDRVRLHNLLKRYSKNGNASCMVMEYGEQNGELEENQAEYYNGIHQEFRISSVSPHFHCLLTSEKDDYSGTKSLEDSLNDLVNTSCFDSVIVKEIPPELEVRSREYASKSYKFVNSTYKGKKLTRKRFTKQENISSKWDSEDKFSNVHYYIGFKEKVDGSKKFNLKYNPVCKVSVDNNVLALFGQIDWNFRNLKETGVKNIPDRTEIKFDDIDFSRLNNLESLYLLKNGLLYGDDFNFFWRQKTHIHPKEISGTFELSNGNMYSLELVTFDGSLRSKYLIFRWYMDNVRKMKLPEYHNNKKKLVYGYEHYRNIWLFLSNDKETKISMNEFIARNLNCSVALLDNIEFELTMEDQLMNYFSTSGGEFVTSDNTEALLANMVSEEEEVIVVEPPNFEEWEQEEDMEIANLMDEIELNQKGKGV